MIKRVVFLVILLVIAMSPIIVDAEEFDFDDLFGGDDLFVEIAEEEPEVAPADALLTNNGLEVGGSYDFSLGANRLTIDGMPSMDSVEVSLGADLFLDARPNPDFRVFAKTGLNYGVTGGDGGDGKGELDITLKELFSDFHYNNKVFFRAGKQAVNWGVGYFFSPADVINIGRINPLDPEADREGPVALKTHLPVGSNNYYLYALFDDVSKPTEIAIAPKLEYVIGNSELGLGGFYQSEKAPRAMATLSSTISGIGIFGEAVLSLGSDKQFVEETAPSPTNPFGFTTVERDDVFWHATLGGRFSHSDDDGMFNVTGAAQYLYNGEGYANSDTLNKLRQNEAAVLHLIGQKRLSVSDLASTGYHYGAAMVGWTDMLKSDFSTSAIWLGNLSDGSGQVTLSLSLPDINSISPQIGVTRTYGKSGAEYTPRGPSTIVFAGVTLGSGSF